MKKLQLVLVSLFVSTGLVASSSAAINSVGDPGRFWPQPNDDALGLHIQQFSGTSLSEPISFLVPGQLPDVITTDPTCQSMSDSKCIGKELQFSAVLPLCTTESSVDCIQGFGTITATGERVKATYLRYFPTQSQNAYSGNPNAQLPDGASGSIWELNAAGHDGGSLYYLAPMLTGSVSSNGSVKYPKLQIQLSPVNLELTTGLHATRDSGWSEIYFPNSGQTRWGIMGGGATTGNQSCAATSSKEKLCAQKFAFPAETRFYVELRVTSSIGGWMHGRISSPEIQITQQSEYSLLEFQGNPIAVPLIYKLYRYTEMPEDLKKWYDVEKGGYKPSCFDSMAYCAGGRTGPSSDPLNRNVIISPEPWDRFGMDQLKLWIPYINDKATALPSYWNVRSLSDFEMENAGACFKDNSKITGIVSTNSTQYSAGPPTLDKAEGTLSYQVAAPHFGTNGEVFKGSYDLVMRSDVARCVYGFSKAPIQATLAITSSDGSPQIATTVIGERDGWLFLRAKNFEFSAPIIKAKLTQEVPAAEQTPTPTTTPSATTAVKTRKAITCTKGKILKKVTGVNPKCPSGYKKKA
jgi:hypothetical protein